MNPTVANIVEQARMGYLALRTGDYRDLRRAVHDLAPQEANDALVAVRVHKDDVFTPAEDVLTETTIGH